MYVRSRRDLHLVCGNNASAYRNVIYADNNGSTRIYHPASNAVRIQTSSSAVTFTGNVMPASDNTYDLGSLTARWANVFVGDMNLSNKGKANDVDGTWGNYTLQEGESDLFLINNRTGKRYKFNLTEIPLGDD